MQELTRNQQYIIGTTNTTIALEQFGRNAQRKFFSAINTSTGGQAFSIAVDAEAVAGVGAVIQAGGSFQISADAGFVPTNKRISAVSSAAGGTLAVMEIVQVGGF